MKKHIIQQLREKASKLPPRLCHQRHTERFTAAEVALAALKYNNGKGPKLDPARTYPSTTNKLVEVNHFNKLKQAYQTGGWSAVEKYCQDVMTPDDDGA